MSYPVRRVLSRVAMISLGAVLARYIPSARLRRVVRVALLPRLASLLAEQIAKRRRSLAGS
ncbi:MAG: hypothetical protein ACXVRK_09460 [Gaiellaceae bacterium]